MLNTIFSELISAWKMFIHLPLPLFMQGNLSRSSYPVDGPGSLIRPLMPLVGAVLALLVFVPVWLLSQLPNGKMTAALAGGVAAPLLLEIALNWEGLNALASFFELRRHGATQEEALSAEAQSMNVPRSASSGIILMTIYALRMIFLGVLSYFAPFWIIVALSGAWALRAELTTLNKPGEYGTPFLKAARGWEKRHWYIALGAMLAAGLFHPFGALLALGVVWLLAWIASNMCLESISGITKQAFGVFSYSAELVLLFLGVLLYAAPH